MHTLTEPNVPTSRAQILEQHTNIYPPHRASNWENRGHHLQSEMQSLRASCQCTQKICWYQVYHKHLSEIFKDQISPNLWKTVKFWAIANRREKLRKIYKPRVSLTLFQWTYSCSRNRNHQDTKKNRSLLRTMEWRCIFSTCVEQYFASVNLPAPQTSFLQSLFAYLRPIFWKLNDAFSCSFRHYEQILQSPNYSQQQQFSWLFAFGCWLTFCCHRLFLIWLWHFSAELSKNYATNWENVGWKQNKGTRKTNWMIILQKHQNITKYCKNQFVWPIMALTGFDKQYYFLNWNKNLPLRHNPHRIRLQEIPNKPQYF